MEDTKKPEGAALKAARRQLEATKSREVNARKDREAAEDWVRQCLMGHLGLVPGKTKITSQSMKGVFVFHSIRRLWSFGPEIMGHLIKKNGERGVNLRSIHGEWTKVED